MEISCEFDEIILLGYLLGETTADQRAVIEQSPACQAEVQALTQQLRALYRVNCPDAATLVAYQEQRVNNSTVALVIRQHANQCPHCSEELALLAQVDAMPLFRAPSPMQRVIATFQSPLNRAMAVRGDMLLYTTPDLAVHLRVRQAIGQLGAWTVRGQVRTAAGDFATDLIKQVEAQRFDGATVSAVVEPNGAFRFERLPAGVWTLALQTASDDIVIEQFVVGDDFAGMP